MVRTSQIVAILDMQVKGQPLIANDYLQEMPKDKVVRIQSDETLKSYVVTDEKTFLSPVSSATLKKRIQQFLAP